MESAFEKILKTGKTVLDTQDLSIIWGISKTDYLKTKVYRLVKAGKLLKLARGLYTLAEKPDFMELANKIVVPSYVSFETVLGQNGVIFQYYGAVYSASRLNTTVKISGREFAYRKIKDGILLNNTGLINDGKRTYAIVERALVDTLYLFPDFSVDNLRPVKKNLAIKIAKMYGNKKLIERIKNLWEGEDV